MKTPFIIWCLIVCAMAMTVSYTTASVPSDEAEGPRTRVIVSDDFEQGIVKSETVDLYGKKTGYRLHADYPRLTAYMGGADPTGVAGPYLNTNDAASGRQSLRIQRSAGLEDHLPILSWWLYNDEVPRSGTLHISFDVKIPEVNGNSMAVKARSYAGEHTFYAHRKDAFWVDIMQNSVSLSGKTMAAAPGAWIRYELSVPLGSEPGTVRLKVIDEVLGERVLETPMLRPQHEVDWIGFLVQGETENAVLLDNIDIRVENEIPRPPADLTPPPPDLGEDAWGAAPAELLEVFPPPANLFPESERGRTSITADYYPSGSVWQKNLDERWVFHRELKSEQAGDDSFALRIGKGGQVYSLRGAFGESVPPSFRAEGGSSPWNDEVWQFVAVCGKYNDTLYSRGVVPDEVKERVEQSGFPRLHMFIHNSGAYMEEDLSGLDNLYCPMLAAAPTEDGRAYRTVNWGLIPWNTPHRSPLLYYVQTRDAGKGVIELTWVVHNFSVRDDVVFDHLNAPWGGTRFTSLPHTYLSRPDGTLLDKHTMNIEMNIWERPVDVRDTGGWNLASAGEDPDSPSLALVFGRDRHLEVEREKEKKGDPFTQFDKSIYRTSSAFRAGEFKGQDLWECPENAFRNYDVAVVIPKFYLRPGETIWYRSFLVVNRRDKTIELAKALVDHVDYGLLTFDPATTPMIPVQIDGSPVFSLYARPVPGTRPLFLLENATTGQQAVTTDMYLFFDKEKLDWNLPPDHPDADYYNAAYAYRLEKQNTRWKRLLGYARLTQPEAGGYRPLSSLLAPALFPETNSHHQDVWVKANE